ncbi:hypothetical protein ACFQZ4_37885 [Catellatospora coxensis]
MGFVDRPDYRQRFDPAEATDSRYFNLLMQLECLLKDGEVFVDGKQRTVEAIICETFATMASGLGFALSRPETATTAGLVGQAWEFACDLGGDRLSDLVASEEADPFDVRAKWSGWVAKWRSHLGPVKVHDAKEQAEAEEEALAMDGASAR